MIVEAHLKYKVHRNGTAVSGTTWPSARRRFAREESLGTDLSEPIVVTVIQQRDPALFRT